ncbi:Scramblase, partial [Acaromyces ingoldii]
LLSQPTLVVTRQMEMLNIFLGFELANRYALVSPEGEPKGYIAETEQGLGNVMQRQFFRNHRPFTAHVLDGEGKEMLVIRRAFKWLTSKTSVSLVDPETGSETLVGEVRQRLTVYRRKYDLFTESVQFASIDGGLWAWDFVMVDTDGEPLGAVSRNFRGFGRELFTDTGQYELVRHGPARALTLDERAVALATAVSCDVDYFSQ